MIFETKFELGQKVYRIKWNGVDRKYELVDPGLQGGVITGFSIETCASPNCIHRAYQFGYDNYSPEEYVFGSQEEALAEIERIKKVEHHD